MKINSSLFTDFKPASSLRRPDLSQRIGETITVPSSDFQSTIIDKQDQSPDSIRTINAIEEYTPEVRVVQDGVQVTFSKAITESEDPEAVESPNDVELVYSKPGQNAQADKDAQGGSDPQATPAQYQDLTAAEVEQVKALQERDAEVRRHEQAHAAAGGTTTGSPTYTYTTGPDGRQYAVAGEVSVRFSSSNDPEKTIAEAQQIKRAATAPAEPSAQDYAVAREADQRIAQARQELIEIALEDSQEQPPATQVNSRAKGYGQEDVEKLQIGETFHVVA